MAIVFTFVCILHSDLKTRLSKDSQLNLGQSRTPNAEVHYLISTPDIVSMRTIVLDRGICKQSQQRLCQPSFKHRGRRMSAPRVGQDSVVDDCRRMPLTEFNWRNTRVADIISTAVPSNMLSIFHHLTHFIGKKAGNGSFKSSLSVLIRSEYWKLLCIRWIRLFRFFDMKKLAKETSVLLFKWAVAKIELIRVTFIIWFNLCWGY